MKKTVILILFSILLASLVGCSNDTPKQLIKVTGSAGPEVKLIINKKDIVDIKEIMNNVKWFEKSIDRPDRKYDYQFWLTDGDKRLVNWEVWYENNQTIIFSSGKTGELNDADATKLKQYLIYALK